MKGMSGVEKFKIAVSKLATELLGGEPCDRHPGHRRHELRLPEKSERGGNIRVCIACWDEITFVGNSTDAQVVDAMWSAAITTPLSDRIVNRDIHGVPWR